MISMVLFTSKFTEVVLMGNAKPADKPYHVLVRMSLPRIDKELPFAERTSGIIAIKEL